MLKNQFFKYTVTENPKSYSNMGLIKDRRKSVAYSMRPLKGVVDNSNFDDMLKDSRRMPKWTNNQDDLKTNHNFSNTFMTRRSKRRNLSVSQENMSSKVEKKRLLIPLEYDQDRGDLPATKPCGWPLVRD